MPPLIIFMVGDNKKRQGKAKVSIELIASLVSAGAEG
jgi:hypothetical protein